MLRWPLTAPKWGWCDSSTLGADRSGMETGVTSNHLITLHSCYLYIAKEEKNKFAHLQVTMIFYISSPSHVGQESGALLMGKIAKWIQTVKMESSGDSINSPSPNTGLPSKTEHVLKPFLSHPIFFFFAMLHSILPSQDGIGGLLLLFR